MQCGQTRLCAGESLVERVEVEHRCARLRSKGGIFRTQRGSAVRGDRTADCRSRKNGQGDHGERQEPPTRHVCLPKHGGGPYHTVRAGTPCLVQKKGCFAPVCDSCPL